MKHKYDVKLIVCVILVIAFFVIDGMLLKSNIDLRDKNSYYVIKNHGNKEITAFNLFYKKCFETSLQNDGEVLSKIPIIDSLNNEMDMSDLFDDKNSKILVCRFSSLNCKECIIYIQQIAKKMSKTLGIGHVVYLGYYPDNRQFNILRNQWGLDGMQVYNTLSLMHIPIEKNSVPYFFVLSSSLQISSVYVPDRTTPKATEIYLNSINLRYFSKDDEYSNI